MCWFQFKQRWRFETGLHGETTTRQKGAAGGGQEQIRRLSVDSKQSLVGERPGGEPNAAGPEYKDAWSGVQVFDQR